MHSQLYGRRCKPAAAPTTATAFLFTTQQGAGIGTWNDDQKVHNHLYFNNLDVSLYTFGFSFQNQFNDVAVFNSAVHDDQSTGIYFGTGITKAYSGHNEVSPIRNGFGYGIDYFAMSGGVGEYNVVHDVGGAGAAYGQSLAAQGSDQVTFQYNEV